MSYLPDLKFDNLVSCPKCNGSAVIQQRWVKGHANIRHYIPICSECNFNYHEEYKTVAKAISKWNSSNINICDVSMYKNMTKDELIQLIIDKDLIPIEQITHDNKFILDTLQKTGHTIVSIKYLNYCQKESVELTKLKVAKYETEKALRNELSV